MVETVAMTAAMIVVVIVVMTVATMLAISMVAAVTLVVTLDEIAVSVRQIVDQPHTVGRNVVKILTKGTETVVSHSVGVVALQEDTPSKAPPVASTHHQTLWSLLVAFLHYRLL